MTRNRALRAIEALVAQRERAVIETAISWRCTITDGPDSADPEFGDALIMDVDALADARALLAKATGATDSTPEPGA